MKSVSPKQIAKQILLGTLIGDGNLQTKNISRIARLRLVHSIQQDAYFFWKVKSLLPLIGESNIYCYLYQDRPDVGCLRLQSLSSGYLYHIYNDFYRNGKKLFDLMF